MRLFSLEYLLVAALAAYLWYAYQEKTKPAEPPGGRISYSETARNPALDCQRNGGCAVGAPVSGAR